MTHSIPLKIISTSRSQPERSDAVANRRHILTVARELFTQQGPTAVSMSDVVKAAEVGRGTLYRHFPNKAELSLAIMDEEVAVFQNKILVRLRELTADQVSIMDQLDEFLDHLVSFTENYTLLLKAAQKQGLDYLKKKEGTPQHWQQITVHGLLRQATAQGEISSDLDLDYLTDAILAPLNIQLYHYQREEQGFSPQRISAGLRSFVNNLRRGK